MENNYGSKRIVVGAHYGLRDWLSQRVTAVLMALFTVVLLVQVLLPGPLGYDKWAGIFSAQWMKVLTFTVIVALAWHAWVGTRDIFMNTPNQAAWFERYVTDWTGPFGRLGRMRFRMKGSVFPGDTMQLDATVQRVETDDTGCGWVELLVSLTVDGELMTDCTARVALPTGPDDNPWQRRGDKWKP